MNRSIVQVKGFDAATEVEKQSMYEHYLLVGSLVTLLNAAAKESGSVEDAEAVHKIAVGTMVDMLHAAA